MNRYRNHFPLSPHFWLDQFESPDTGQVIVDRRLVLALDTVRTTLGMDIIITSGYRTTTHNAVVGGVTNSLHMSGQAADLVTDPNQMGRLAEIARAHPDLHVIVESDHVHVQLANPAPHP